MLEERSCDKCTVHQKTTWGCEAKAQQPLTVMDGETLERCPRRPFLDKPIFYSDLFWNYKQFMNGFLPESGGLEDQPSKLIELFRIIGVATADGESTKKDMKDRQQRTLQRLRTK